MMEQIKKVACSPAFVFSLRLCISSTLGMLFILVPAPIGAEGYHFPDASSVFITTILVSFFPSLDAASSMKKSIERMGGTIVGAAAAIALGFLSLLFGAGTQAQSAFLGTIMAVLLFVIPYYMFKTKGFSYGQVLGYITFGLIALVFYNTSPQPWLFGVERCAALLVGCCISMIVSLVVLPKPLEEMIDQQMKLSMKNMGKAAKLLLEAAGRGLEGEGNNRLPLVTELFGDEKHDGGTYDEDEIYQAYGAAANLSLMNKAKLSLLKYDPFLLWSRGFDKKKIALYAKQVQTQRARLNRLIASIISLDSLYRLGVQEVDMAKFNLCDALIETGKRVEIVLDMTDQTKGDRNEAARLLLVENLAYIRQVRMDVEVQTKDNGAFIENIENLLKHQTLSTICSDEDSLCFFLRHVEHVIMRCVRLHYCFQDEVGEEVVEECAA